MWDVAVAIAMVICCFLGVAMTAIRLPGTWLITFAALGYGWWSDWQRLGWLALLVLFGIALLAEVFELLASMLTARKAGASRQAAWGGLIGGFVGMLLLSFLVPIPIVGTLLGAVVGCFGGAMIVEFRVRGRLAQGARVGLFSALGFALGAATKVAIALGMSGIVLTMVLWPENGPSGP